jgi:hypothetical protein
MNMCTALYKVTAFKYVMNTDDCLQALPDDESQLVEELKELIYDSTTEVLPIHEILEDACRTIIREKWNQCGF